ncbi:MAG TPA: thiamine-phosphate kinase [Thermomicrobiales bacterium]|nr:thiamine-phosphate kinase [Thermomicrobiales bacterium]
MTLQRKETVARIGEFALIDRLRAVLVSGRSRLEIGIGDDAAVWHPGAGMASVITTDALVERVHFRRDWTDWRSLGHKALAVNLSDIAAMGARPVLATVTLGIKGEESVDGLVAMYEGMGELARLHETEVAGGDIVRSPDTMFISVTVIGEAERGRVLTRSGARIGDAILVSGTIGASAAGLALLEGGDDRRAMSTAPLLIAAHLRPNPRIALGQILAGAGVTAAMDLSDGLLGDLPKILSASGVAAQLWTDRLPILPAIHALFPDRATGFALRGGEDYELLMTIAEADVERLSAGAGDVGATLTRIGTVTERGAGRSSIDLVYGDGRRESVGAGAFDHFGTAFRAADER